MSRKTISGSEREQLRKVFNTIDTSGDGFVGFAELFTWFAHQGYRLDNAFQQLWKEIDTDGDNQICFEEFNEMVIKMRTAASDLKGKIIPRHFLEPKQYNHYAGLFQKIAGDDGQVDCDELGEFLASHKVTLAPDRLQAIMKEVDADGSGYLEESEFLVLLVKTMGLKKRKVGPGLCSPLQLHKEGWSYLELKQVGYTPKQFLEASLYSRELLSIFSLPEFRKNGVSPAELKKLGWDGTDAKSAGYGIKDLLTAQFTVKQVRQSGYDDVGSAAILRRSGVGAAIMKHSGWTMSSLKAAGFSGGDLRLGGFSADGIQGLHRIALRKVGEEILQNGPPDANPATMRPNTCKIRSELDATLTTGRKGSKTLTMKSEQEKKTLTMPLTAR